MKIALRRFLDVWRQLDRYLCARIIVPWLPVLIVWQVGKERALTPQVLGALATVVAGHTLSEGRLNGVLQLSLGALPLLGGALVCAGASSDPWTYGIVYYLAAGLGATLDTISDVFERR